MNKLQKGITWGLVIVALTSIAIALLILSLSGCLLMAGVNAIKNDTGCEAYNSDVQRGSITGPLKVCKEPAFRF